MVTDSVGCIITASTSITQPPPIQLNTNSDPSACNAATGIATATVSGVGYTYSWNTGETTEILTGLSPGTYSVIVTDSNGCTQPGFVTIANTIPAPATLSVGQNNLGPGESTQLIASTGLNYYWSPSTGLSCTNCATPIASPIVTTNYCVWVTDINGCADSACVLVNVGCENVMQDIFVPNAFSPNDDGVNDRLILKVESACIKTFTFRVYNRWGEKVFETSNADEPWDGSFRGQMMGTDVFAYTVYAKLSSREDFILKGNISLIR